MNTNMGRVDNCRFAVIISGKDLQPEAITASLALQPTSIIRKGQLISRLPEIRAEEDEWTCMLDLHHPQDTDEDLDQLLDHLIAHRDTLLALSSQYEIDLVLSVQSNSAHMSYQMMPVTLDRFSKLGLPLKISSISWGEVDL